LAQNKINNYLQSINTGTKYTDINITVLIQHFIKSILTAGAWWKWFSTVDMYQIEICLFIV